MTRLLSIPGIGPHLVALLAKQGISTTQQLAMTSPAALRDIPGIGARRADSILSAARQALESPPPETAKLRKPAAQVAARKAPKKGPVTAGPVSTSDTVETSAASGKAAVKVEEDNKKAVAKTIKAQKKAAKKAAAKEKAEAKAAAKAEKKAEKKAAKKKAKKKAAKKKVEKAAKASKSKKSGKTKKK